MSPICCHLPFSQSRVSSWVGWLVSFKLVQPYFQCMQREARLRQPLDSQPFLSWGCPPLLFLFQHLPSAWNDRGPARWLEGPSQSAPTAL